MVDVCGEMFMMDVRSEILIKQTSQLIINA